MSIGTIVRATAVGVAVALLAGCGAAPAGEGSARSSMAPGGGGGPIVRIAHRGASAYAPENTAPAYDLAQRMAADYLELDVYLTRDGVPVILHDATLDRTARGPAESCTGQVGEKTLAQIRACDAGSWFNERFPAAARPEHVGTRIPTLDEFFARYGRGANYLLEIKQPQLVPGVEEKVLEAMERHGLREPAERDWQVVVQSFSVESNRRMHALAPRVPVNQLLDSRETPETIVAKLDEIRGYAIGIGPSKATLSAEVVRAAHERCLQVFPYTVNDSTEMRSLLAMGVDGIISDYPDRLAAVAEGERRAAVCAAPARR